MLFNSNRMLDDLTDDVGEAQERMNFVMERMSRLLKTKGAHAGGFPGILLITMQSS